MKSMNPGENPRPAASETVQVIDTATQGIALPIVRGKGAARAVLWPGNGSKFRSFHVIILERGDSTVDLHHPSDCVYYVVAGAGEIVDLNTGERSALSDGAMVHIDAGDSYRLQSESAAMRLIGGPCPPDPAFYASTGKDA